MKKWHKHLVLLVALVVGAMALRALIPSDERRVHALLAQMVREINEQSRGGTFSDLAVANRVADYFGPEFEIRINATGAPELDISDRSELIQMLLSARKSRRGVKVSLLDPQTVGISKTNAVVEATGKAEVSGETDVFVSELRFTLVKIDRRWRIRRVETIRTFE